MPTDILVRAMTAADCARVVQVHLVAFKGFFLTFLGARFLRLLYSEAVALNEIALVAEQDGRVIGFVMGSTEAGAFFGKLLRRKAFRFAIAALPAVLHKPRVAMRVARAIRKPREAARPHGTATLMSLGVDPGIQGSGAGKLLVLAFNDEARRRGSTRVDLTTDKFHNDGVNAFYRRMGFTVAREIVTAEHRVLNEYEQELTTRPRTGLEATP